MRTRALLTSGLLIGGMLMAPAPAVSIASAADRLVLEQFRSAEADGFPIDWENESARSGARARQAYRVKSEDGETFLAVRDADQRIKKKKIEWEPKAFPVLSWRWRLQKVPVALAPNGPLAVLYVSLDTDLLFIPVFTKYVWSPTKPEGTLSEGGMFSGTELVVQSGVQPLGVWVEERVNAYEDFKRIHRHEPAEKAWGISVFAAPGVEIDFGPIIASREPVSSRPEASMTVTDRPLR
jgi:hypothetical protein